MSLTTGEGPVIRYRPDIDGLRAVAVLSIVLFHIRGTLIPGGFVGVDIFFVISGFLITSILQREMSAGTFSFATFYRRRIRRIAPAYLVATGATLLAGALLMLPADLRDLARSALWSAFSLPNVYFWLHLDTSYFAPASDQVPLLHLWSLGVEEQFYLLWPVLLLAALRLRRIWLSVVIIIAAVASFALAQTTATSDASFSYYMLPTRAGELLIGALLALHRPRPLERPQAGAVILNEVIALAGFGLVAWSLIGINEESLFPGINAVYPCIGTAMLIFAGEQRPAGVMAPLRWKPVVWIGLISYSLYLWHWPVLAFTRYFLTTIDVVSGAWCLLAIFVLAWLSYRFVEMPTRQAGTRSALPQGKSSALFLRYAICVGMLAGVSSIIVFTKGLEPLIAPAGGALAQHIDSVTKATQASRSYPYSCQTSTLSTQNFKLDKCVIGPDGPGVKRYPRALLIGDSNAAHYVGMLSAVSRETGLVIRNVTMSACPPIFGAAGRYGNRARKQECTRYRREIARQSKQYRLIILGGQWSTYEKQHPNFSADLEKTVRLLTKSKKRVILLGLAPNFPTYERACEIRGARLGLVNCRRHAEVKGASNSRLNRKLAQIARRNRGAYYMDITKVVCPDSQCTPYLSGQPIYYDHAHLSMEGSRLVGQRLVSDGLPLRQVFMKAAAAAVKRPQTTIKQTTASSTAGRPVEVHSRSKQ